MKTRFEKNPNRHRHTDWKNVEKKLISNPNKLWSLSEMERTGGEPDVVEIGEKKEFYIFIDCSKESPSGRRSLCYDRDALNSRKTFKPKDTALDMATDMDVEILTEDEYKRLQSFESFDTKTSSWIETPSEIRKLGGAIFADRRYNHVFIFHNGADSYYDSRGFRVSLRI